MAESISNTNDVIDVRKMIERFEELETELAERHTSGQFMSEFSDWIDNSRDDSDPIYAAFPEDGEQVQESIEEFYVLREALNDLRGKGGNKEWRGAWYPITLIHESHFTDAMKDLCEDIGDFRNGVPGYYEIDWEATANNLRADYESFEFDGQTYWFR